MGRAPARRPSCARQTLCKIAAFDPIVNPFPSGVTFSGPAFSEPTLIALAYAFEQATRHRVPPASTPPLPSDAIGRR